MPTIVFATVQPAPSGAKAAPTDMPVSIPRIVPDRPAVVPTAIPGIAQNEATATAQYNEAVRRSQNGAVVLPENDPQPVQLIQVETERQAAGDNVPTAEPVQEGAPVVNIQETHECKHGQVWTENGCKNPEGDKGSKSRP
jgi:hypothetical protein